MKIKTSELTGAALDWAVAECEGLTKRPDWAGKFDQKGNFVHAVWKHHYKPSTCWEYGGPIIDREGICWNPEHGHASRRVYVKEKDWWVRFYGYGPTPLIAAMRCHVASHLGEEVEIPEELV